MIITKKINLGYVGEIKGYKGNVRDLISMMDTDNATVADNVNLMEAHTTECINGVNYLIYTKNETITIYKQLPLVHDDDVFRWKTPNWTRDKQTALFAQVDKGMFRFCCTAYTETGRGRINVYMTYGRRMNGQVDQFNIDNEADNEAFLDAINNYISEFVNKVMYQYDIPKGSNYMA